MMNELVDGLLGARRSGIALDLEAQPQLKLSSFADGYAVQAAHTTRHIASHGGRQLGYKLGATSLATMQALGFPEPFSGPILSTWLHASPANLPRSDFFICAIELEVCVRLGADLTDPELTMQQLRRAIADVFPVIEIADSRYKNWKIGGAPAILADLGNAGALITGEPCAAWQDLDLDAMAVTLFDNGVIVSEGSGSAVVDGPLGQLLHFARKRITAGAPLRAGDIISTGSCIAPYPAKAGQRLVGRLAGLGDVTLNLD